MTRTITQQSHGLRIFALIGAFAITVAAALGNVGGAAAEGESFNHVRDHYAWRMQMQTISHRIVVPGVSTGDQHVAGSGGESIVLPAEPETPTTNDPANPSLQPTNPIVASPTPEIPVETTPVATPTPAPPAPSPAVAPPVYSGACPALIYNALGVAGCKISYCESGWRANAVGLSGELGWFQVHPRWHGDATLDPAGNVAAAVRISNGGTNWSAWSVRGVLASGRCPNGTIPPV